MTDSYSKLYYTKKGQLSNSGSSLGDVRNDLQRVSRANSAEPVCRPSISEVKSEAKIDLVNTELVNVTNHEVKTVKKVAYMGHLDEVKKDISNMTSIMESKHKDLLDLVDALIKNTVEEVDKKLDDHQKFLESVKSDNLKVALNEVIEQFNSNSKTVASQLKELSSKLDLLKQDLDNVKEMF